MSDGDEHEEEVIKTSPPKTWSKRVRDALIWVIKDQWFLLGMITVVIIASQVQVPADRQATKQVVVSYVSGMRVVYYAVLH